MAIPPNNTIINPWDLSTVSTISSGTGGTITASSIRPAKEYAIQGQMYKVSYTVSDAMIATMQTAVNPDDIKKKMVHMLAEELWKNNAIEFTKIESYDGNHVFHARIFATPNTQVRILRENPK
jgi:ribosomal protein S11